MQEATPKATPKKRKRKSRGTPGGRLAFVTVCAVLLVYVVGKIFSAYFTGLETEPAVTVTVHDSIYTDGWFFRNESVIEGQDSSSVKHTVYSGERVQKDAPLATIYSDVAALEVSRQLQPLESKISLLDTVLQTTGDDAEAAKVDQLIVLALQQLAEQMQNGSGIPLSATADSVRTLSLRREAGNINTSEITAARDALAAEHAGLEAQLRGKTREHTAPYSGYYSDIVDGYEQVLTPDALDELSVESFRELTGSPAPSSSAALGKIIQGFTWYLVSEVSAEQAERLSEGQNLRVSFTQASLDAPVTVHKIVKERGSDVALVVLEGTSFDSEMVSMRRQPIEIIIAEHTGLRVPKQSVRMLDGELGVFILSGTVEKFKRIDTLYETSEYFVVQQSATDVNALVAKDQIIVRGKNLQNNMVVRT